MEFLGANKKEGDRKGGGVGVYVDKNWGWQVTCQAQGSRGDFGLFGVKRKNKWVFAVGVVYMSATGTEDYKAKNEDTIRGLEAAIKSARRIGIREFILMGDFNGHIMELDMTENWNGKKLKELASNLNLSVGNVERDRLGGKTWWQGDSEYTLDYVMWDERFGERVVEEEILGRDQGVDSDHGTISLRIVLGSKPKHRPGVTTGQVRIGGWRRKRADWAAYRKAVDEGCAREDRPLEAIITEVASRVVGRTKGRRGGEWSKHKLWFGEMAREAVKNRRKACKAYNSEKKKYGEGAESVRVLRSKYEQERAQARKIITECRRVHETGIIANLGEGSQRTKGLWAHMRDLIGADNRGVPNECVNNEGTIISGEKGIKEEVERVWRPILGGKVEAKIGEGSREKKVKGKLRIPIDITELETAIKNIKLGKAEGPDGMIGEFLKELGGAGKAKLLAEFNNIMSGAAPIPEAWREARVRLIPKGGNPREIINYRPIAVIPAANKLFSAILQSRMSNLLEEGNFFGSSQTGFRPDKRVEDNVFVLGLIREISEAEGRPVILCFLDLQKAYDRVSREKLWDILRDYGFDETDVSLLQDLYKDSRIRLEWGNIQTDWIHTYSGVKQGCPRAPTEFNIYIQEVADRISTLGQGFSCGDSKISVLMYADDIVLVSESEDGMTDMLKEMETIGTEYGFAFSLKKSKIMRWNSKGRIPNSTWTLYGQEIEEVNTYTYLGVQIDSAGAGAVGHFGARMKDVGKAAGMLKYAGGRSGAREWLLREGWKGVCVPKSMYCLAVLHWGRKEIKELEMAQTEMGRWLWRVGRWAPTAWVRGESGWSSMEEREAIAKIKYLARLAFQGKDEPGVALLNHLVTSRAKSRWVTRTAFLCKKYRCSEWEWVLRAGDTHKTGLEEWGMDDRNRKQWEREIERKVRARGLELWKESMKEGGILDRLRYKEEKAKPKWEGGEGMTLGQMLLSKLRGGLVDVRGSVFREKFDTDTTCRLCGTAAETESHWLKTCPFGGYTSPRRLFREDGGDMQNLLETVQAPPSTLATLTFLEKMWTVRRAAMLRAQR